MTDSIYKKYQNIKDQSIIKDKATALCKNNAVGAAKSSAFKASEYFKTFFHKPLSKPEKATRNTVNSSVSNNDCQLVVESINPFAMSTNSV